MLLNILTKHLEYKNIFDNIITILDANNGLLLIQNGIYWGLELNNINNNFIYALKPDILFRGLIDIYPKNIYLIDYSGFVDLVFTYNKNITY